MEEWKEYRLGDISSMKYGKLASKIDKRGNYPIWSGYRYVGTTSTFNCKKDTVIVVARGVGGTGDVKIAKEDCFLTNLSIAVNLETSICNPKFFYYMFQINNLKYLDSGSAQSQITIDDLKKLKIKIPSLNTQNKIVSVLSSLDDKIEVNRKINENLEQQAQALFKSWFVDFEPFKDGKFVEIGDVVKTTSGGTPSRKKLEEYYTSANIKWIKSKELRCGFIIDSEEKINEKAIKKSSAKILPKDSVLIAMYGATVGQYGIINEPMACNQAVCALIPNDNYPYTYLYMFAKNNKDLLINKAVGSAQQNISQVLIKQIHVSSEIERIRNYHKVVFPLFENIRKNTIEIENLTSLRDTLLPKLMSGEIEL